MPGRSTRNDVPQKTPYFRTCFAEYQETGWARTAAYEYFLDDNISVADAMAL